MLLLASDPTPKCTACRNASRCVRCLQAASPTLLRGDLRGDGDAAGGDDRPHGTAKKFPRAFMRFGLRNEHAQGAGEYPSAELAGGGEHLTVYVGRHRFGEGDLDFARAGEMYLRMR